jgi:hypothetical protein
MIVLNTGDYLQAKLAAVPSGGIKSVTLGAGGTGYTAGSVTLTVVQAGAASGTIVGTASAGGIITSLSSVSGVGTGYSVANGLATTAAGGSNCTINITTIYQPSYSLSYIDDDDSVGQSSGFLSGTTAVTILSPVGTKKRMLDLGIIFNSDKAAVTPIVELVSSGNTIELIPRASLAVNNAVSFGRQPIDGGASTNQELTTTASPTFGGITQIGSTTNYLAVGSTGLITMVGTGKGKLQLRPHLINKASKTAGVPTEIYRGVNVGYSMPIWSTNDEELYFRMRVPNRWDGTTDPQVGIVTTLIGAEDVGDKYRFQLEWQTTQGIGTTTIGTTTSSVTSEQTLKTGGNAQYSSYFIFFTLDADDANNPIVAGRMMQTRLRRIAASGSEVTGEIGVWDCTSVWCTNKMYPVWSTESNVT